MSGITIETKVYFRRGRCSKKELRAGEERKPVSLGRIPRLSRLMALAIRIESLVRDGTVTDYAAAALLGHVTRARKPAFRRARRSHGAHRRDGTRTSRTL